MGDVIIQCAKLRFVKYVHFVVINNFCIFTGVPNGILQRNKESIPKIRFFRISEKM